jgi:kinesin family protein 6/9
MIATISLEERHLPESISTAKFAQEVALIKNRATLNVEEDPKMVISKLKGTPHSIYTSLSVYVCVCVCVG